MSEKNTVSRPYAQAIFEIAVRSNSIQRWKETLILINKIVYHPTIRKFLSGSVAPERLDSLLIKITKNLINEKEKNLIKLLSKNQRFSILNSILEQFLKLELFYKNILIVELITVFYLEKKDLMEIKKILEELFFKKIQFICKVDKDMLGGGIIKINDTVFDFSIRSYLKQLSDVLNF